MLPFARPTQPSSCSLCRPDDVLRVRELMEHHGSIAFARELGSGLELAATAALDPAFSAVPDSPHVAFIRGIVPFMLNRSS